MAVAGGADDCLRRDLTTAAVPGVRRPGPPAAVRLAAPQLPLRRAVPSRPSHRRRACHLSGLAPGRAYPRPCPEEQPVTVTETEFASIADQASIGLIRFDAAYRVRLANQAAHRLLERRAGSLLGKTLMGTFVDHRLEELVRTAAAGRGWLAGA